MIRGEGHPDYIDYLMSQKFGVGWKKQDAVRMARFIEIMRAEADRDNKRNEEGKGKKSRIR